MCNVHLYTYRYFTSCSGPIRNFACSLNYVKIKYFVIVISRHMNSSNAHRSAFHQFFHFILLRSKWQTHTHTHSHRHSLLHLRRRHGQLYVECFRRPRDNTRPFIYPNSFFRRHTISTWIGSITEPIAWKSIIIDTTDCECIWLRRLVPRTV